MSSPVPRKEAFLFWLKLGFISFGGPAGQIAIMHRELVERKKWISESKFLHALNYCMLLPGPEAQQLATYTGWLMHGIQGGVVAGVLFILPSAFILLLLSILYVTFGSAPAATGIFAGLKPAVLAVILLALFKIAHKSLHHFTDYLFAAAALLALVFFKLPYPFVITAALVCGLLQYFFSNQYSRKEVNSVTDKNEYEYAINRYSSIQQLKPIHWWTMAVVFTGLFLLPYLYLKLNGEQFYISMAALFTKAALVTFGGAYSVLTYIAQVAVEKYHWLTHAEMIDGLALGETTPGPLIMVLAFVGFMAGYHHYLGSLLAGSVGLGIATWFTFLPSFAFILLGAPMVERTQENTAAKKILQYVSAAVTGVVANLLIYTGATVLPWNEASSPLFIFSLCWFVVSVAALKLYDVNMVLWLLISAISGICFSYCFPIKGY